MITTPSRNLLAPVKYCGDFFLSLPYAYVMAAIKATAKTAANIQWPVPIFILLGQKRSPKPYGVRGFHGLVLI